MKGMEAVWEDWYMGCVQEGVDRRVWTGGCANKGCGGFSFPLLTKCGCNWIPPLMAEGPQLASWPGLTIPLPAHCNTSPGTMHSYCVAVHAQLYMCCTVMCSHCTSVTPHNPHQTLTV